PRESIVLEEFVTPEQLIPVVQSIVFLHSKYSDRFKRAKSRLKFLVERFGEEDFKAKYRNILRQTLNRNNSLNTEHSPTRQGITTISVALLAKNSKHNIELKFPRGDLSITDIKKLVSILSRFEGVKLQVLQNQNLLISHISDTRQLAKTLEAAGFELQAEGSSTVTCPGAWTCRLGITASRALLDEINNRDYPLKIHVSGCHNGCAQPQLADIGLHGEARRKHGSLIPYYQLYLGGSATGGGQLALKGAEIPAGRILSALDLLSQQYETDKYVSETFATWVRRKGLNYFNALLADLMIVHEFEVHGLITDVGQQSSFKVAQLGGGECAAVTQESASSKLAEIDFENTYRKTFLRQADYLSARDCLEKILTLSADILVLSLHRKSNYSFAEACRFITNSELAKEHEVQHFLALVDDLKNDSDEPDNSLQQHVRLDKWLDELQRKYAAHGSIKKQSEVEANLDLRGKPAPLQFLKLRKKLLSLTAGSEIKIILDSQNGSDMVIDGLEKTGFIVKAEQNNGIKRVICIRKPELKDNSEMLCHSI
ncbi:MAG: sulfurtransferase TusA family protein, partial [Gammaproteobacteria bacterium]|nr:sulfurtransferase TusA family protein [Gammaproteobacteria bacterium]